MNNSKTIYNPCNPCRPQLYKTVQYRYYRYPTKYICTPVEWGTKSEKHVFWAPEKPYPPVKVKCEQLRQSYGQDQQDYAEPKYGFAQEGSYYESDGYAQDYQYSDDDGDDEAFDYSDE